MRKKPADILISEVLKRPDMVAPDGGLEWRVVANLAASFELTTPGQIRIADWALQDEKNAAVHIRHALELALLTESRRCDPVLAGLAAARVGALFARLEGWTDSRSAIGRLGGMLAADAPPSPAQIDTAWRSLADHQTDVSTVVSADVADALCAVWLLLGPAEVLMEHGGDVRLRVHPDTGLNVYGCSHRPRPWAITFASSTASSSSERGYLGAEACRRRITLAALGEEATSALVRENSAVRREIQAYYGLSAGCEVVLAASGTDCELFVLAIAHLGSSGTAISNLLIAPDETGSGVPLAARGRHFAIDTSRGVAVKKETLIDGFRADTRLVTIPLVASDGAVRSMDMIDKDCRDAVEAAVSEGRKAILHLLDVSKLGRVAPSVDCVRKIRRDYGDAVDVVVDACQARLTADNIRSYLEEGWIVLVTGSKFFTGPPFSGAVLLPPKIVARLQHANFPSGLGNYSGVVDWPPEAKAPARLRRDVNYGLVLRWQAALAEMQAFRAVPPGHRQAILNRFCTHVRHSIESNPDVELVSVRPLERRDQHSDWDSIGTIISFAVLAPGKHGTGSRALDPVRARQVYNWLNANIAAALPAQASGQDRRVAATLCHVGQPVPVTMGNGAVVGVLRISAGARLVSGEPSHARLGEEHRLEVESADVSTILDKISLILRFYKDVEAVNPQPRFG